MNIFFSIIIPTYNRAFLLSRALRSLQFQTYTHFEVIVIDDGSNDNTEDLCNKFKDLFRHFVYIKIPNSGGPARPRNFGIETSKGNWICFLDSDDYWYPNKLELCSNNISTDTDVLYHDLGINKFYKTIHGKNMGINPTYYLLTNGNRIPLSSSIIRKEIINNIRFFESKYLSSIEDYIFWIEVSLKTNKFKYLKKKLGYYQIDKNNRITQFNEESAYKFLFLKNYLIKNNILTNSSSFFINYSIAINLYNSIHYRRSSVYFKFVIYKHPSLIFKFKSFFYLLSIYFK